MNNHSFSQKFFLIAFLCLIGCATPIKQEPSFYDNPGLHIQHDTAVSMNWLAIAGAVTIAFGVAAFMNGQKTATSILAGGVTLLAVGIIAAQALAFLCEYRTAALVSLIGLGILGFFIFTRTVLDINGNGISDWEDIKSILFKIRLKK